jgi:hypothetical protein
MSFQKIRIPVIKTIVLSLLLLFQGVWAQESGQTTEATSKGSLQVIVTPSDAKISVIGPEEATLKNGEVKELGVGSYVVTASLENYRIGQRNIEVTAENLTRIELSLIALSIAERGWELLLWLTALGVALRV